MNANEPPQSRNLVLPVVQPVPKASRRQNATKDSKRSSFLNYIPDRLRNHFVAMCGEYVGTVLFLFFALSGTQVANTIPSTGGQTVAQVGANPQQLQYIALCFGFSLAVNAWVFFRISGGLFNPAVTFGMCLIGALPWVRGCLLFVTQILGGVTAAALVSCMFPGELNVRTSLGGDTTVVQGLFIEMFLTAQLIFTIFMLAAEKHKGTFIAPVGIGLALFIAELTGVFFTGGSLNPARTFGPSVVLHEFHAYHWIYWLGPILGSIVAAGFYKFIKVLEYETANPGQDMDHAARVDRRKNLLLAAGINEVDAAHVAQMLSEKEALQSAGSPCSPVTVTATGGGQGVPEGNDPMYGTNFRPDAIKSEHSEWDSNGSDDTFAHPQRPAASATGNQAGRYSYLGSRGAAPGTAAHAHAHAHDHAHATSMRKRQESPAMATNEQLYAPLVYGQDVALGGDVEPRQRVGRTPSSFA